MRGLATWPPGHRPAPGGGLAVLVVVTVLVALAAPHATAVRGRLAGGPPTLSAPTRPAAGPPATTARAGWTGGSGPCWWPRLASTGFGCRACAAAIPGTSRAP